MHDVFFLPGFKHRDTIDRPRFHFCGLWGECKDEFKIPPRIHLYWGRLDFMLSLPHRSYSTGWFLSPDGGRGEEMIEPRQVWPRLTIFDRKRPRYWWPLSAERDRLKRVEYIEKRKRDHDQEQEGS